MGDKRKHENNGIDYSSSEDGFNGESMPFFSSTRPSPPMQQNIHTPRSPPVRYAPPNFAYRSRPVQQHSSSRSALVGETSGLLSSTFSSSPGTSVVLTNQQPSPSAHQKNAPPSQFQEQQQQQVIPTASRNVARRGGITAGGRNIRGGKPAVPPSTRETRSSSRKNKDN